MKQNIHKSSWSAAVKKFGKEGIKCHLHQIFCNSYLMLIPTRTDKGKRIVQLIADNTAHLLWVSLVYLTKSNPLFYCKNLSNVFHMTQSRKNAQAKFVQLL